MTTIDLARRVVETQTAHLFRPTKGGIGYDVKPWEGSKRGWTALDLFSASTILALWTALSPDNRARLEALDPVKAALLAAKMMR
jgi:hypothetical protein